MILLFEKKCSLAHYDYHWLVPPAPFTSVPLLFKMPSCVESATLLRSVKHSLILYCLSLLWLYFFGGVHYYANSKSCKYS